MPNENTNEQEIIIEDERDITQENTALRELLLYDLTYPWEGIFAGKARNFNVKSYSEFKAYYDILNSLVPKNKKQNYSAYRIENATTAIFLSLINNEHYKEMTEADFDAEILVKILKTNGLSQKNMATIMRHCKINTDFYLENLELFSPYFNTLKKYNPELKNDDVKLLNEVAGKKKNVISRQEKLERGDGRLTAYKSYTPQETETYSDSFSFCKIFHKYELPDSLGRSEIINEDALDYYMTAGVTTFRNIRIATDKYIYNSITGLMNGHSSNSSYYYNGTSLFDRLSENVDYSGKYPFNNVYPCWEASLKTLKDNPNETINQYARSTPSATRIYALISLYINLYNKYQPYFVRNLLSLDENYISEKEIYNLFYHLKVAEILVKENNLIFDKTFGMYSSYDQRRRIEEFSNKLAFKVPSFSKELLEKAKKFTDELFELYKTAKHNEKTKEFINSERYWKEFSEPKEITQNRTTYNIAEFKFLNTNTPFTIALLNKDVWTKYIEVIEK